MSDRAFLDTNVFVYAIVQDDPRSHSAEKLISDGGTISVQVLNEFAAVVTVGDEGGPGSGSPKLVCGHGDALK